MMNRKRVVCHSSFNLHACFLILPILSILPIPVKNFRSCVLIQTVRGMSGPGCLDRSSSEGRDAI
jgi:hypothetical protein